MKLAILIAAVALATIASATPAHALVHFRVSQCTVDLKLPPHGRVAGPWTGECAIAWSQEQGIGGMHIETGGGRWFVLTNGRPSPPVAWIDGKPATWDMSTNCFENRRIKICDNGPADWQRPCPTPPTAPKN
jgi:hypothetical protein